MAAYNLLLLAGDGIGPEVMAEVKRLLGFYAKKGVADFRTEDGLVGGASYEQRLSLGGREVEKLSDDGANRAARHNNWPFRAEWPSRSDGDCRGERLQNREPRLHLASVDQNGFERFGNTMAPDTFGAVAGHQADD